MGMLAKMTTEFLIKLDKAEINMEAPKSGSS